MGHDCLNCDAEIDPPSFPFGDNVTCVACGQEHETEMEESSYEDGDESLYWWITKKVEVEKIPDI